MVKKINVSLMNAGSLWSIKGVVIHNDAGSTLGTPEWYVNWLRGRDKSLGIAHYYITRDAIARVVDTDKIAYHTGDGFTSTSGNANYIGYEVCQSMGASDKDFLANEEMTFMQVAEDMLFYNLPVNRETVRLHREFVPTSCPHRSWDLHGQSVNAVKDYFISRIKHYQSIGKTVDEMIAGSSKNLENTNITKETDDMAILISAEKRGIAMVQGGRFLPVLDIKDVGKLEERIGSKVVQISQRTFDEWQKRGSK
ncbi:peptidoglycan recognition protein family protein [Streptococcus cuniculi]|uniref:N-acetylmuramoyl-L-alanine amidase n=1 Tax=Streptococcus cuniculi TaxID=1432788 RepID=A0A4Y9JDE0_9STRE|nr:N-acetylmuramoyl-L-alanine amidase [Streptococcus cuniculi]MBF0778194.1 N-acetylmuramoyl-L-alanine amidase [Streptococcus cuniculi]TFU97934.1 lysozyme [Streptococcus cuniculi]